MAKFEYIISRFKIIRNRKDNPKENSYTNKLLNDKKLSVEKVKEFLTASDKCSSIEDFKIEITLLNMSVKGDVTIYLILFVSCCCILPGIAICVYCFYS